MLAPIASVLLALASADLGARLDAQLRSEARGWASELDQGADLELAPRGTLALRQVPFTAALAYAPDLVLHPTASVSPDILHRLEAGFAWREREVGFTASEFASYGTQTFWFTPDPAQTATGRMDLLPGVRTVAVASTTTVATLDGHLTRHVRGLLGGWFVFGGGLDDAARRQLPLERSPHLNGALDWTLGERDALGTRAAAEQNVQIPGTTSRLGELTASLTHRFEGSTLALEGGAGALDGSAQPSRVVPAASISFDHELHDIDRLLTGSASLQLGPTIDRLSGEGYLRGQGQLALTWNLERLMKLTARVAEGVPVDSPTRGNELFQTAELNGEYAYSREAAFSAGLRGTRQRLPADTRALALWGAFINVTVREEVLTP